MNAPAPGRRGCRCSGSPLDLELPPTRATTELDEQFRKARLEEVVCDFLTWVLPTSSVLVFEDVHLMDDASADLHAPADHPPGPVAVAGRW